MKEDHECGCCDPREEGCNDDTAISAVSTLAGKPCDSKCCEPVKKCLSVEYPSCCTENGTVCKATTLPSCCQSSAQVLPLPQGSPPTTIDALALLQWRQAAILVSIATVLWNIIEGTLSVVYGAEDVSVALLGFGADSWVEVLSAMVVVHRFWTLDTSHPQARQREKGATLIIGSLLLLLAFSIIGGSITSLSLSEHPESSIANIAISSAAILVMCILYIIKIHIALNLSSAAMESDAQCSLCCVQLSIALFVGSLIAHFAGDMLWWFDGATALVIALLVGREGYNAIRNARRLEFDGCGCCDGESGWYISWLRRRRQLRQTR